MQPNSVPSGYSVHMYSEDTLIQARRMDSAALARIHDRHYPEIYRYVRFRLEDEHVAEDITAEVFVRLIDALHKQRGPDLNLRGWLFGTASNLVNDHLRSRYAKKEERLDETFQMSPDAQPDKKFEETWRQEQVRKALGQLTAEQQHVLSLRFTEDRSLEETAEIIGKSITAVKALQFRAVAALRRMLDQVVTE